jgi:hypothetical protein
MVDGVSIALPNLPRMEDQGGAVTRHWLDVSAALSLRRHARRAPSRRCETSPDQHSSPATLPGCVLLGVVPKPGPARSGLTLGRSAARCCWAHARVQAGVSRARRAGESAIVRQCQLSRWRVRNAVGLERRVGASPAVRRQPIQRGGDLCRTKLRSVPSGWTCLTKRSPTFGGASPTRAGPPGSLSPTGRRVCSWPRSRSSPATGRPLTTGAGASEPASKQSMECRERAGPGPPRSQTIPPR